MKTSFSMPSPLSGVAASFLLAGSCWAGVYPLAPWGSTVTLQPGNFIQSMPDASPDLLPRQLDVLGPYLDRHPGAVLENYSELKYFVGQFDYSFDRHNFGDGIGVMLWETTGECFYGQAGPSVRLGYWDGDMFRAAGDEVQSSYYCAGYGDLTQKTINSSVIPFSDFNIADDSLMNAVRVTGTARGHDMVSAVAADFKIPEPSTLLLAAVGLLGLAATARRRATTSPLQVSQYRRQRC
ncbi:MAG: PEP-CTERM sorting domain-containing protein [Rhizobacter sp.]